MEGGTRTQNFYPKLSKMSNFQQNVWDIQRNRKTWLIHGGGGGGGRGKPTTQIAHESDQMLDLTVNGDFK